MQSYWYQDNVNTTLRHTESDTYDALNRLTNATAKDFSSNTLWGQTFNYDQYGNMGCVTGSSGYCPQVGFDGTTNRISNSGYTYDAAGDLTNDGTYAYTYDAEGHMISAGSTGGTETLTYNALGEQVREVTSAMNLEETWDPWGRMEGTYNSTGWRNNGVAYWWPEYVRVAGRVVGFYNCCGEYFVFLHKDAVGSTRMVTYWNSSTAEDEVHYPYGELETFAGAGYENGFAGFARASWFTDNMPTLFRQYAPEYGRWMTPDPTGGDITDPQSLNRYAYVENNPATSADPLGLQGPQGGEGFIPQCGGPGQLTCAQYYGAFGDMWGITDNAIAEGIYGAMVNAVETHGWSYTEYGTHGAVTYTLGWSMASGTFWVSPSDVALGVAAAQEAQLPALSEFTAAQEQLSTPTWALQLRAAGSAFGQAMKDAWGHGYFGCVANGGDSNSLTRAAFQKGAESVAEAGAKQAAPSAAGAWYHFTDARFTAWGRSSEVIVPRAAETIGRWVDGVGWVWTDYDLAKGVATCNPF